MTNNTPNPAGREIIRTERTVVDLSGCLPSPIVLMIPVGLLVILVIVQGVIYA